MAGGIAGAEDPAAYLYPKDLDQASRRGSEAHPDMVKKEHRGRTGKKQTVKKQSRPRAAAFSDPGQELARLFENPHIALSVVVSEVLSAPRAYKPHRRGRK